MRKILLLLSIYIISGFSYIHNLEWNKKEISKADKARNISYLTENEKDVILYLNLARMYPKKFASIEVVNWDRPSGWASLPNDIYKNSLIKSLNQINSLNPIYPDKSQYITATCLAEEQSLSGKIGHHRKRCKDNTGAENCSYGMYTGKDVVIQLLVDQDVSSLGHRKNFLGNYSKIGVAQKTHPKYKYCTVIDLGR